MRRYRQLRIGKRRWVWNPERKLYEAPLLEEHVVKEIIFRLRMAGIAIFRECVPTHVIGTSESTERGHPDLHGWVRGQGVQAGRPLPLYIEVKRPGGRKRPAQIEFIDKARHDGCIAFFAESWEEVRREMATAGVLLPDDAGGVRPRG